ncbi:MAG: putative basic amino acid antiporter YfcC [Lysobacterales bacterium]
MHTEHQSSQAQKTDGLSSRMPDTYLLVAAVGLLVFLLSYFLTPGVFEVGETTNQLGEVSRVIDPDSFRYVEDDRGSPLFSSNGEKPGLFNAVYEGLVSGSRMGGAVGIIAFILLTGGAFGIVMATGAVDRALRRVVSNNQARAWPMLCALFFLFSLGGAVFGMGEEVIPFVLMLTPVLVRMGYDKVTVILLTYAATQVGFATSWMNPFNVAIAQGIADLPLLSGMPLRMGMWSVFTVFGMIFMLSYASRCRVDVSAVSIQEHESARPALAIGDWMILVALVATVGWIVWGVVAAGYYLPEIATQFVILGVASAVIGTLFRLNGMTANSAVESFRLGAQGLLPAALIIGFARGIVYLMGGDDPSTPSLLNTLLHFGGESLGGLPGWFAAWLMFIGQGVFNFFVTSGSGQAALTMPIIAPLSDLVGVTRQVSVLAFQLGDGLTNILVPTSAALMGSLGAARLEWLTWIRATVWFFIGLVLLASIFVIAASVAGFS